MHAKATRDKSIQMLSNSRRLRTATSPLRDASHESTDDPGGTLEETTDRDEATRNCYIKFAAALLFLGFIMFIILDSTIGQMFIRDGVTSFLAWTEEHPGPGVFAFILVYLAATVLFVPGLILTLGAGFVFANAFGLGLGLLLGSLAVFVGASAGAIVSFLVARYILRDWVVRGLTKKYVIFAALDSALAEKGYRIMTLLRLSPIIPFNALNYVAGVTALGFLHYVLSLLAILPGTILYVFLGASAGSVTDAAMSGDDNMTVTYIVVAVGVVFGVLAVALTSYYAKQELDKVTRQSQAPDDSRSDQQTDQDNIDIEADSNDREAEASLNDMAGTSVVLASV
jgi:uncharacterized membrane protein YdjX (TVP38/TMEM64 family)